MKTIVIALVAAGAIAGVAQASPITDKQFVEASRCSGLASSENLGKLDTTSLDALLRAETPGRKDSVRVSAVTKMTAARRKADSVDGAAKAKLQAERAEVCTVFLNGGAAAAQ